MQFAVHDHVYLLDISTLSQMLSAQDWQLMATEIFCNKSNVKLGKLRDKQKIVFAHNFQNFCSSVHLMDVLNLGDFDAFAVI